MRAKRNEQPAMFYAIDVEARLRADHPLRPLKQQIGRILASMNDRFEAAYSQSSGAANSAEPHPEGRHPQGPK